MQQQPFQGQPYYPPQQRPPRRRISRRTWLILAGVIVGVIILSSIGNAVKGNQNSSTDAPTVTPQPVATKHPIIAQPRLGEPVSAFTARYGQAAIQGTGGYVYQSGNMNVTTQPKDGATFGTHVLSILLNAPGNGWTETEAINACSVFMPTDATYTGVGTLASSNAGTGIERLYFSTSLAHALPASEFLDGNLNPTKPGTFAMILNYLSESTTTFASCAIQAQLE